MENFSFDILLFVIGTCGLLVSAIALMIYRRIGAIETLMRDAIHELAREDKLLHGRVTEVGNRVTRLETRCDNYHGVVQP